MARHAVRVFVIVLLGVFLLALQSRPVGIAQGGSWSEPINISNSPLGSWFPDLAVDNLGIVHVVWCETEWDEYQGATEYLYYTQWNEEGWTQPNDIVAASMTIHRNSIAADSLGNLYLVVIDDRPERPRAVYLRHAPVQTAYSAAAWSDWRLIGGIPMGYASDVVVDRENRIHVIYTESISSDPTDSCPRGGCSDVFYRQSRDGGRNWSQPINLSRSDPGTKRLGLMVDWYGRVHAFWDEGGDRYVPDVPFGVAYAVSHDGGISWSATTLITSTGDVPQQIVAGFDGKGQTVIAYRLIPLEAEERGRADPRIYYRVSLDGITWSSPQPIPGILGRTDAAGFSGFDQFDMATDSAGNLHLVGVMQLSASDSTPGVFHLRWDGERWSAPERIFWTTAYPEYPHIVVERGNVLHVVWAVKESAPLGPQRIDVWYTTKQLNAPEWTPVPVSLPTATPASSSSPTAAPTVSPYPTPLNINSKPPTRLDTESDEVLLVVTALLPVLLTILLLVGIRAGWLHTH